jgi:phosphatidate cytidylyltransferase
MAGGSLSGGQGEVANPGVRRSDLGVRTASAVVMLAVVGADLWLGGWWWTALVALVGLGVLWDWRGLVWRFVANWPGRALWMAGGAVYVGIAAWTLAELRGDMPAMLRIVLGVIATDIGAYFAGRTIGGPKIAPAISPSKTWAGLLGGMAAAALFYVGSGLASPGELSLAVLAVLGAAVAIVAQAGDFFESWMKRRAGVKDSGRLIPGHGGLFDRVDGLLAVLFVAGILAFAGKMV